MLWIQKNKLKCLTRVLDNFAPWAHRIGIGQFKSELEDIDYAFVYLYPLEYKRLNRRLQQHHKQFRETLDKSQELLQRRLDNDPTLRQQAAKVEVSGRTKEIYSLWHKMETKNEHNLENILDLVALRVVITPKPAPEDMNQSNENETDRGVWLCYHVFGLVQQPTRVQDYISLPVRSFCSGAMIMSTRLQIFFILLPRKPNSYQSLRTALRVIGQKYYLFLQGMGFEF